MSLKCAISVSSQQDLSLSSTMAHTKRKTYKYNNDAGPSGWVQEKQNKDKEM